MPARQPATGSTAAGTLFVVATPIGNLGDVTMRALETLRAVPLIAAEDTRVARRLLARYEIGTHLVSHHARSGPARLEQLLSHLRGGLDLAVVTDAGTPAVSDPGAELVGAWTAEGGRVVPIPGASAALAAVSASAIAGPRWTFEGFPPRSGRERRDRLARIAAEDRGVVVFEAPTRLSATLRDLATACGGDRAAEVHRELTKLHEQIARGSLGELVEAIEAGEIPQRGEVVIVIAPAAASRGAAGDPSGTAPSLAQARRDVAHLVGEGMSRSGAARTVSRATGIARRDLYREAPGDE